MGIHAEDVQQSLGVWEPPCEIFYLVICFAAFEYEMFNSVQWRQCPPLRKKPFMRLSCLLTRGFCMGFLGVLSCRNVGVFLQNFGAVVSFLHLYLAL